MCSNIQGTYYDMLVVGKSAFGCLDSHVRIYVYLFFIFITFLLFCKLIYWFFNFKYRPQHAPISKAPSTTCLRSKNPLSTVSIPTRADPTLQTRRPSHASRPTAHRSTARTSRVRRATSSRSSPLASCQRWSGARTTQTF